MSGPRTSAKVKSSQVSWHANAAYHARARGAQERGREFALWIRQFRQLLLLTEPFDLSILENYFAGMHGDVLIFSEASVDLIIRLQSMNDDA